MKNKNITKNEEDIVREICKECSVSEKLTILLIKICKDNNQSDVKNLVINHFKCVKKCVKE